ncbi:hypothetical protein EV44_g6445 [Erysiphe necator]|uniref:WHIM1 domain-containing protein n=1 Tax=Uncinula necator TaxID=52586 RepID=A0A0B1NYW3_UNCNE|nr:hypothetical protein EV44_g6445 [Erysiphe necator]
MISDESSDLSSAPSDTECDLQLTKKDGLLKFFTKIVPANENDDFTKNLKREPSPVHEYILADNQDIAFIVMFRSRFTEAFPKSLVNFGPQELEQDVVQTIPGEGVESFLCALLGLLLNRKQEVKSGHYNRALEEAIQSHKSQWAKDWQNKTPLSKGATFSSMTPEQRLTLLRTLILWALSSSETLKGIIQSSYKQQRQEDDLNQPLSVQPWGSDSNRQRYYLIEGLYDTQFRVYREGDYMGPERTWYSVAGNIEELKALADRLQLKDGGQKARLLSSKILAAIPRFEAAEEKRKRKEYRTTRKQFFKRADPDYSIYEGRTRGKRIKYTFSDEDEENLADLNSTRRSMRSNGNNPKFDNNVPAVTQSGRQVKSRQGGAYGETIPSKICAPTSSNIDINNDHYLNTNYGQSKIDDKVSNNDHSPNRSRDTPTKICNGVIELGTEGDDSMVQDSNDGDEAYLESEIDASEDFSDEYDERFDDEPKKINVRLPVQSLKSDKKTGVNLQLSLMKEVSKTTACAVTKYGNNKKCSGTPSASHINKTPCSTELTKNFNNSDNATDTTPAQNITKPHSPLAC